jgi:hypothetical protein
VLRKSSIRHQAASFSRPNWLCDTPGTGFDVTRYPIGSLCPYGNCRNLGLWWFRYSRAGRRVRASTIVMDHELLGGGSQVPIAKRNQEVETLSPDSPNRTFAECIGQSITRVMISLWPEGKSGRTRDCNRFFRFLTSRISPSGAAAML